MIRIRLLWVGKAQERYVESGVEHFLRKLRPYAKVECETLKPAKSGRPEQRRAQETEVLLARLEPTQRTVLLDERGERRSSENLARWLEQETAQGASRWTFVVGGAYGVERDWLPDTVQTLRLSDLTMNHQLVRLVLLEQLYRAFTIQRGEPYHHA
ncbi:MAG: 23S rRNA (pseudouridine(1915)-N(3))-methyltransferase RlmH [SAR324 cluster bacterium]|nr:23S rRNA (pseudouridine(1915)-N(3))-methyltransferase RlmH [SAR324 cluster bacterium]